MRRRDKHTARLHFATVLRVQHLQRRARLEDAGRCDAGGMLRMTLDYECDSVGVPERGEEPFDGGDASGRSTDAG